MKKLLLSITFFSAIFAAACSSDDDGKKECDCVKQSYRYITPPTGPGSYEYIEGSDTHYSNNCNDNTATGVMMGNAESGFYKIKCNAKN